MNWEARSIAVVAALIALPLTGCGGGTPSDGLEDKSAAQVQEEAAAAIRAAKSVHVIGTSVTDGASAEVDLRIQDGSSSGTITLDGAQFEITRVGEVTYVKADEGALESLGIPPEMLRRGTGRWLKLAPQEASALEGFSLDSFAQQLTTSESPLETEVEQTELDGTRVVVISNQDGSKLYVANADPAYPIRGEFEGANAGRIDFSEYDVDFQISAPENSVELGELAWLDAITNLRAKIDEPFLPSEINLTQEAMVSLGSALGECSPELARIGSPTERLQPVYALVAEACAKYDEGAKCFDTAASVSDRSGGVEVGTPEEQTQTSAIDCGFAAYGDGGNLLAAAQASGNEIINASAANEPPGNDGSAPSPSTTP
jgi:hypothetical protein